MLFSITLQHRRRRALDGDFIRIKFKTIIIVPALKESEKCFHTNCAGKK